MPVNHEASDRDIETTDTKRTLAAIVAVYISGIFGFVAMPLLVGYTVEAFDVREGTAGIVMGVELGAVAFSCLLLSFTIRKLNAQLGVFLALAAFLAGSGVSMWAALTKGWPLFVVARAITGFGEGCLMAAADAMAAGRRQPERAYSVMQVGEVVATILVFLGIMILVEMMGPAGAFAAVGGIGLIALPFLLWFPKRSGKAGDGSTGQDEKVWDVLLNSTAILLFIAGGVIGIGFQGLWAYVERIGVSVDLSMAEITFVLMVAVVASVTGPVGVGLLGTRYGRTLPIMIGAVISMVFALTLVYAATASIYFLSVVVFAIAIQFLLPYLKGLPAFYDSTGRLNAAWLAPVVIGSALGPMIAGLILNAGGTYKSIGWMGVISIVIAVALLFGPIRRADLTAETLNVRGN
jgi:predicted MFS family arabinose efflux permease